MCMMGNQTSRDQVWRCALRKAIQKGERVTPDDVSQITGVSERVCRETMYVMYESGWLQRQTRGDGSVYYESPIWIEFHPNNYPG
jgi:predicted transcriptional regulator of viral defense system